jgi:hypothetical protein
MARPRGGRARHPVLAATLTAALAALGARPEVAHAQVTTSAPAPADGWYGWQTLMVDGLALGAGLSLASSDLRTDRQEPPSRLATVGTSLYLIGATTAPAVHFAHRQNGIGLADMGVRLVLPALGSVVGMATYCLGTSENGKFRSGCAGTGSSGGLFAGALVAAGLDALFLAREQRTTTEIATDGGQRWYGWQLLLVDGAGLGLGLLAANRDPKPGKEAPSAPLAIAAGMYTVGFFVPPLVHFAHGRFFRGLGDWGVRALLAPAGALVGLTGYCAATGGQDGCTSTGAELGFLAGVVGASLFDMAALSWDDPAPRAIQAARADVLPSFQLVRGGVLIGAASVF